MTKKLNQKRFELKGKLRSRKTMFAAWTSLAHPSVTEMFAKIGVDFIGIDIEHSTISQEQSQRIIAASQSGGSLCLPRVATHNMEMIKRLLDSGADGLIVPMVETASQAREIASWMQYPPQGIRGFGISRAQGYGFDFDQYINDWNESGFLIVQIESITAVDNIDKILSVDAIDGVMIGPYDISGSLGIPGQIEHAKVKKAAGRVIDACKKFGKGCGTQDITPCKKSVCEKFDQGYTFVVLASDIFILLEWGKKMQGIVS
ncbi:MAG: 4-hydroxy-2-oxovalerate aldolase [Candidatus Omnitrophica bacterium]|nr:4-hydroxy-2-oxovalerate aldolase [Candidatus Omnitrophota bacterium]